MNNNTERTCLFHETSFKRMRLRNSPLMFVKTYSPQNSPSTLCPLDSCHSSRVLVECDSAERRPTVPDLDFSVFGSSRDLSTVRRVLGSCDAEGMGLLLHDICLGLPFPDDELSGGAFSATDGEPITGQVPRNGLENDELVNFSNGKS